MASDFFRFKQFTVFHDRSTMKVGTDGVLLGAWCKLNDAKNILDIGTGSGLIALMLAQRSNVHTHIDAVEIESHNAEQAIENVQQSPWREKIIVHQLPVQEFFPEKKYELIVSNPPYFKNSYQPPDKKRTTARHTVTLTFTELLSAAKRLLATDGKFNVVLPHQEAIEFIQLAETSGLFCTRQGNFRTREKKPIERLLLEFSTTPAYTEEEEILLYLDVTGEEWSDHYKQLTRDFYLKIEDGKDLDISR
jgi:tRNA1Val (adenine37-N6)-methyltransferase